MRPLFKQTYIRLEAIIWSVRTLVESRDVARKATASLSLQRGKKYEPETVRWSVVKSAAPVPSLGGLVRTITGT